MRERPSAGSGRASWPNSRASRPDLAAGRGRRSAQTAPGGPTALATVPGQRSATALATPPDGLAELAALLGLPGQRSGPPSWAGDWSDGMPAAHPSAPVPAPAAPAAWAGRADDAGSAVQEVAARAVAAGGQRLAPAPAGWPTTEEIAALEAPLRRRRRAAPLPAAEVPVARAAAPLAAPPAPAPAPAPLEPAAPLTRRARRAAEGPADLQPRSSEPARPGSRRALREQAALAGRLPAAPPQPAAPAAPAAPVWPTTAQQPTRSDTEVLAQLEALLAEPTGPGELDLRTDPLFPGLGWTRHRPDAGGAVEGAGSPDDVAEALLPPAAAPAAPTAPAAPVEEALAPSSPPTAPWTQPVGITPVVLAPAPVAAAVAEALASEDEAAAPAPAFAPRRGRGAHRLPRRVRVALPHVAVVSALGVATLVAPLVGTHLRAEADTATGSTAEAGASTAKAAAAAGLAGATDLVAERAAQALTLSRTSAREAAVQAATDRAAAAQAAAEQAALAQQQELERQRAEQEAAARAAAEHQAAVERLVGQCSGTRPDVSGTRNGRLTDGQMCDLWAGGHQLRSDAAVAFAELNLAYREHFGKDIVITDSYRSYAAQVAVRRKKPTLAAVPGTSEHGWGLAVDLGDGVQNSDEHYDWLIENAPKYGWDHPAWARKGGGGPYEPWHWEFVAGE